MFHEEKTFQLKFNLEATFPEEYEGQDDEYAWLHDWETRIKPDVLKIVFEALRSYPSWNIHVRNRGKSPIEEIEIAMVKDFSHPPH